ncbi:MAG: 50S ribosomal protein L4 [Candidatus Vogelbacteria bacterium]|nr:50S ribosomal protein L4 [Candidatus Vogelbacteria bacterium]
MEAKIYNRQGKESGSVKLPEKFFGLKINNDLIHQVIESMNSNARQGNANSKDRSEVRGGGKKPWKQKGTGRARHGSRRSPIWVGGGTTHGPRSERDYSKKINRKMKTKALFTVLSAKLRDGEVLFTEPLIFAKPEAKLATKDLGNLSKLAGFEKLVYKTGKRALIVSPTKDEAMLKSFANIKTVVVEEARNINPLTLATYKYVLITDPVKTIEALSARA